MMSDPLSFWNKIRREATSHGKSEPVLKKFYKENILAHKNLGQAMGCILSEKLSSKKNERKVLKTAFKQAYKDQPNLLTAAAADSIAVCQRDPACHEYSIPLLFFKGYQALQAHRVAHWLWIENRKELAYLFQSLSSEKFSVDIHPAACLGKGIFFDHATAIVIGETAVVSDNVSILQEVTLGGTGKKEGDRHPKIREGVLISAGAKILGNVVVGEGAKIGAGAVVLKDIPPHSTAVGVPAKVIGKPKADSPALEMDQSLGDNGVGG